VRCVSHEIRTPLNVAIAGLDIVKRTCNFDSDADTASLIDDILDSCKVAVTIVDDLLAYEKLSSGVMALDKSIVEVKSLILSTVSMFNLQALSKEIAFSVLENEDAILSPTYFQVDSGKITQVLRNFISNAMKFTPQHGVVRVEATESDGFVTIRVIDSGVGIAVENLPKVFRDIVQFDVNKNQEGGGSGMGLWLSKQIVELHGGAVAVSSEGLGKGCCFEVRLRTVIDASASFLNPPVIVVPVNHPQPQNNISTRTQRVHPLPSHHCLVVDDSKLNRKVMMRFLQLLDYATEEAGDGMQCVDAVKEGAIDHFSLVFIDNSMPVLSGPDAVTQLREMGYRGIIIGVTGNAVPEDMRHFVKSGANEVLVKPVTYEMLEKCLVRYGLRPK
jgi:CheY-like chemotaxis protein/anti-sigma regulatory factor (Ser/Thr protein kinase)